MTRLDINHKLEWTKTTTATKHRGKKVVICLIFPTINIYLMRVLKMRMRGQTEWSVRERSSADKEEGVEKRRER